MRLFNLQIGSSIEVSEMIGYGDGSWLVNSTYFKIVDGELWHNSFAMPIPSSCHLFCEKEGISIYGMTREEAVLFRLSVK